MFDFQEHLRSIVIKEFAFWVESVEVNELNQLNSNLFRDTCKVVTTPFQTLWDFVAIH